MYVSRIQTKLKDLGYYKLAIDGIWGPKSRAGLQSFKVDRGLGDDDAWNPTVEAALWRETKESNHQEPIGNSAASSEGTPEPSLGTRARSPDDVRNGTEAHDSKR
jgi:peptidoglycan hydrolase-like protein with peptidoglycan-binding domain